MRLILLITTLFFSCFTLQAQVPDETDTLPRWKRGGLYNLTFANTSLTNWQGGGENAFSVNSLLRYEANYETEVINWMNDLTLGYGVSRLGQREFPFRKNDDVINFISKLSRTLANDFNYSLLADFHTQFAPGYFYFTDTLGIEQRTFLTEFMSPGYLISGLGVEYMPDDSLYLFLSPLTVKSTFVLNDSLSAIGAYGLEPGSNSLHELGAHLNARLTRQIMQNVGFETRLRLFSAYKQPMVIDIDWQTITSLNVNRYITALFTTHLIYDPVVEVMLEDGTQETKVVQFKHVLNVGLKFEF